MCQMKAIISSELGRMIFRLDLWSSERNQSKDPMLLLFGTEERLGVYHSKGSVC